jgi:signal transduction histidine kinase
LSPPTTEQLELIHRNGLRLYKLVDSLLDFSSLETGRTRATFEPVGLASFTHDLVSIFRSAIKQYGDAPAKAQWLSD